MTFSLIALAALLLILTIIDLCVSNFALFVTDYSLESDKISEQIRIVQLSDLHEKSYGKDNKKLLEKVTAEEPDLIVFTGDIVDRNSGENLEEYLKDTITPLTEVAPVYYCIGNHERQHSEHDRVLDIVRDCGAVVLDGEYSDITVNGQKIRIGGLSYYRFWDEEATIFLRRFCSTDRYTLLLCHYPEFYTWGVKNYPVDLILSGHTHGGMIRLPFVGGVIAPEQGWFPEYDKGIFEGENSTLIISSGLASSPSYFPRLNNPPEILKVEIN